MDPTKLAHMANRIAAFFAGMPDEAEGVTGVEQHLRRYWAPIMRRELIEHAAQTQATDLHPLVVAALDRLREDPA